ncbi:lipoprotein-releasing ABC transporter permease subunit [Candidatus Providencia siddallii]|uniref:Lipoprotein-releasing system transmembrane protein LolC n=1 Tax=Candidatus Providencia siddallii TaxID=1715285 RepID=A0ABP1CDW9_9GAMM
MNQSVSLFIGLRYIRGNSIDKFRLFISILSTIGITIGVTSLIIITSVMNGFEKLLQKNIFTYIPHAILTTTSRHINPKNYSIKKLNKIKGINRIEEIITDDIYLQSKNNVMLAIITGIDSSKKSLLLDKLIIGNRNSLINGKYNVFIGIKLAENLNIKYFDKIRLIAPNVNTLTPLGRIPNHKIFTVSGIFKTDSDSDENELLVSKQDAIKILHYPNEHITGWRLFLDDPLKVDILSKQHLPDNLIWIDWREKKGNLFQSVKMEKNMMFLLLSLIIIVAVFNIISSLFLLVIEKKKEIAILKTLGLNKKNILTIFIFQGSILTIIGSLLGVILGVIFSFQINTFMHIFKITSTYITIPVVIDYFNIFIILFFTILFSMFATIYPSFIASTIEPIKILRYE